MNDQDYELLSQYMDGELDVFTTRKLEQRLNVEPQLAATLQQLGTIDRSIKQTFNSAGKPSVHVSELVKNSASKHLASKNSTSKVVQLPKRKARATWQFAAAATLVAAAGLLLMPDSQQPHSHDAILSAALESTPSMASGWKTLSDGRQVRPVLSFQNSNNQWCREFLLAENTDNARGVACRTEAVWTTQVLVATAAPVSESQYRPAGAGDSEAIAQYLEQSGADVPLSASSEAALINSAWH